MLDNTEILKLFEEELDKHLLKIQGMIDDIHAEMKETIQLLEIHNSFKERK